MPLDRIPDDDLMRWDWVVAAAHEYLRPVKGPAADGH